MRRMLVLLGLSAAAGLACAAAGAGVDAPTVWILFGVFCAAYLAGEAAVLSFSARGVKNEAYLRAFARNLAQVKKAIRAMAAVSAVLAAAWLAAPAQRFYADISAKDFASVSASAFFILAGISCAVTAAGLRRLDRDVAARIAHEAALRNAAQMQEDA